MLLGLRVTAVGFSPEPAPWRSRDTREHENESRNRRPARLAIARGVSFARPG